jgi:hypothetical protein
MIPQTLVIFIVTTLEISYLLSYLLKEVYCNTGMCD